jgi:hypothetical protein
MTNGKIRTIRPGNDLRIGENPISRASPEQPSSQESIAGFGHTIPAALR